MDVDKVLYHLKEADKELNRITESNQAYGHQSYMVAMSDVYDFVLSIKSTNSDNDSVIRDDY